MNLETNEKGEVTKAGTLTGRHFLVNIALEENSPGGIFMINRDPRKQPRKPDVYVGVVEEVGPDCFLVKPGDKVSFKRWEWQQYDIDDERLVAREKDLVILGGEIPAPGMIVVKLIEPKVKTSLALPDTMRRPSTPTLKGEVLALSPWSLGYMKGKVEVGQVLIFQKSRDDQWRYPDGRMVLKVSNYFEICAVAEKCPVCGDIHLDDHPHWTQTPQLTVI